MPIFEYRCLGCEDAFEALVRARDEERAVRCPRCDGAKLERVPSVFAPRGAAAKPQSLPVGGGCPCGDPAGPCNR